MYVACESYFQVHYIFILKQCAKPAYEFLLLWRELLFLGCNNSICGGFFFQALCGTMDRKSTMMRGKQYDKERREKEKREKEEREKEMKRRKARAPARKRVRSNSMIESPSQVVSFHSM